MLLFGLTIYDYRRERNIRDSTFSAVLSFCNLSSNNGGFSGRRLPYVRAHLDRVSRPLVA